MSRRCVATLVMTLSFWIGFAIAATRRSPRIECYERAIWAKADKTWHSHGEWVCFEN